MLLAAGALQVFLSMLRSESNLDLLRNVSWTISNFFRWKEEPVSLDYMRMVKPCLPHSGASSRR
jgi:importin subunit alpha-2